MSGFNPAIHGHRRYNPLLNEWVLVSPHRLNRPWDGKTEPTEEISKENDANNPLGPGSKRRDGIENPMYDTVFVFTNDFPAMIPDFPEPETRPGPFFKMSAAKGTCRVICYHPKSNMTMGIMAVQDIFNVVNVWIKELEQLGAIYEWVQIFENKGLIMGCSNPHPHGQVWASSFLPTEPRVKDECQRKYFQECGRPLLMDYLQQELEKQERIIIVNDDWVVLVPFWAKWPFETMILPRSHVRRLYDLNHHQKVALADIMRKLHIKYDNIFNVIFPFSMGWHGAPTGHYIEKPVDHWVLHCMFYPPLLRSATVKKFMVGYEMLAESQRDFTPEHAATLLRAASDVHFMIANQS